MQEALVTGGSGFIGGALIRALVARGFKVRALMRSKSLTDHLADVNYQPVYGDLREEETLVAAARGVDYVFHLAGMVNGRSQDEFTVHNAEGTARLGRAVHAAAPQLKRFVYVSSVAAMGPSESIEPLLETGTPRPISMYGRSKLQGEVYLDAELKNIPLSILRPPPVYGPRDRSVFEFIKILNKGIEPILSGSGPDKQKYYNFIFVDDLVDLILAAALNTTQSSRETYFAVGDTPYSWAQIMAAVKVALGKRYYLPLSIPMPALGLVAQVSTFLQKATGRSFALTQDKYTEMKPDFYVYSNAKAREKLNFVEKVKIEEGMRVSIEWYKKHGWL